MAHPGGNPFLEAAMPCGYAWAIMRILIIMLVAFAAMTTVSAGTYKWVDKNGKVHYSDTPPPEGAQEVDLPEMTTFDAPDVPERPRPPAGAGEDDEPVYADLHFISPKQDQVFWATGGEIPVQLSLEPGLQQPHSLQLYFNGNLTDDSPLNTLGTTLTGVVRGTHTLRAAIVGPDGEEILSSAPVTFHVKQQAIAPQTARPPRN